MAPPSTPSSSAAVAATAGDRQPPYPSTGGGHMDKRVLLIYTGGTMGMLPRTDGSLDVSPSFFTQTVLAMEEMRHPQLPTIDILEYEHLMDSACLGPADWRTFACEIERHYYSYDGFVIVHGTDTMAYTASALVRFVPPPENRSIRFGLSLNLPSTTPNTNQPAPHSRTCSRTSASPWC